MRVGITVDTGARMASTSRKKPRQRQTQTQTTRRLALIDADTGEIMPGLPVVFRAPVKLGVEWFMSIQQTFVTLAVDREITGETWRVLAYILGRMEFENWMRLSH